MNSLIATTLFLWGASLSIAVGLWVDQSKVDRVAPAPHDQKRPVYVGDFPEYHRGARDAGRETFWR